MQFFEQDFELRIFLLQPFWVRDFSLVKSIFKSVGSILCTDFYFWKSRFNVGCQILLLKKVGSILRTNKWTATFCELIFCGNNLEFWKCASIFARSFFGSGNFYGTAFYIMVGTEYRILYGWCKGDWNYCWVRTVAPRVPTYHTHARAKKYKSKRFFRVKHIIYVKILQVFHL